jgi:tRNA threonylcarbamoyl adenosine modification protein YeaZ
MKILALDFSSAHRSAAILDATRPGEVRRFETLDQGPRKTQAFALIETVLREAGLEPGQVDCLAVGLGPGSYTGIRVSISMAQGWQLARGVRLLGLSSMACLAAQAQAEGLFGRVHLVIDAQREEFYLAAYDIAPEALRELEPLRLASFAEVKARADAGAVLAGPGITEWFASGRILYPHAATLARLATGRTDFVSGDKLEPIYLRETAFVKAPPPREIG